MPGHITDDDADFPVIFSGELQKIIVVAPGFIAVNTFPGDVQPRDFRVFAG